MIVTNLTLTSELLFIALVRIVDRMNRHLTGDDQK